LYGSRSPPTGSRCCPATACSAAERNFRGDGHCQGHARKYFMQLAYEPGWIGPLEDHTIAPYDPDVDEQINNVSADTLEHPAPTPLSPTTVNLQELELQQVHSMFFSFGTSPSHAAPPRSTQPQQHHSAPPELQVQVPRVKAPQTAPQAPQAAPLVILPNRRNRRTAEQAAKKDSSRHHKR